MLISVDDEEDDHIDTQAEELKQIIFLVTKNSRIERIVIIFDRWRVCALQEVDEGDKPQTVIFSLIIYIRAYRAMFYNTRYSIL